MIDTDKAGSLVGSISFTVTNASSRNLTFRARGEVDGNAKLDWFAITNTPRTSGRSTARLTIGQSSGEELAVALTGTGIVIR